jgi:hypothetical protein
LHQGEGGAQGDDAANLKPFVVSLIVAMFENPLPLLSLHIKSDRRFEHDITGRLFCPIDFNWDDPQ